MTRRAPRDHLPDRSGCSAHRIDSRQPTNAASIRSDAAVEFVAGSTALAVCDILWGSIPMIMAARSCSHLGWEAAAGMPTFGPDERDLTSVEPDHHRSLIGRQTLAEPPLGNTGGDRRRRAV